MAKAYRVNLEKYLLSREKPDNMTDLDFYRYNSHEGAAAATTTLTLLFRELYTDRLPKSTCPTHRRGG